MAHSMSKAIPFLAVAAVALSLATSAAAQVTSKTEKVVVGAKVTPLQLKGEVYYIKGDYLVVKMAPSGDYRLFHLPPGKTATIDGVVMPLNKVKPGTVLSAAATITERSMVDRTVMTLTGTVWWASAASVILTLENGENRQYDVPKGLKFSVDGQARDAVDLKQGMKVSATKIVEAPSHDVTASAVVTGVSPK